MRYKWVWILGINVAAFVVAGCPDPAPTGVGPQGVPGKTGAVGPPGPATAANLLINGNFSVWQRGIDAGPDAFAADRWLSGASVVPDGYTRQNGGPSGSQFNAQIQVSGPGPALSQRIEAANVANLPGAEAVLSYSALTTDTAGTLTMGHAVSTPATPDDWSNSVSACLNNCQATDTTLTTSWQRFSTVFTVPASAANGLEVSFVPREAGTFQLAQVQLEVGTVASPFQFRDKGSELRACLRYWQQSYGEAAVPPGHIDMNGGAAALGAGNNTATPPTGYVYFSWDLGTTMREPANVVIYNPDTGAVNQGTVDCAPGTTVSLMPFVVLHGKRFQKTGLLPGLADCQVRIDWTIDAEL